MIRGAVVGREAVLPLRLRGPTGVELDVDAVLDTGFTGSFTLPPRAVAALGLVPLPTGVSVRFADGSTHARAAYEVEIDWGGTWRPVLATELDCASLIGMRLLAGHEVFMEVVPGGVVDVTPIP